ncbi:MAG: transglycosylase domain-containing protein [Rhodobacteraceae bacterium]|nr:transglycosylase domain-containing protein [Paracoccaceae bacterium]
MSRSRKPLVAERRYPAKAGSKPSGRKPNPPKRPRKAKAKRRPWYARLVAWIARLIWSITWRGTVIVTGLVAIAAIYVAMTLPDAEVFADQRARGSVTMLDRDGQTFAWRGDQYGGFTQASAVSPHVRNAVIATEDKRFYSHLGVSPRGIASAVRINLREGRGPLSGHGGSTLTQQTAKLVCLGVPYDPDAWPSEAAYEADCREGSITRKVREAIYALGMEIKYSKDEILTIYLNRAFLGSTARGFEAASQRYFGKPASQVSPAEAAMMAGLLVAPSRFAPTNNLERSQERAATVVHLMEEQGYLSFAEARDAQDNPATLSKAAAARQGGYFADWVMGTGPDFFTYDTTEDVILKTTFDPRIQRAAEEALTLIFDTKVREGSEAEAAIVVMSADGAVRAMVGGRDLRVNGAFNRATQANRQTGSTFKPFVYATAMDLGYGPLDTVVDEPWSINVPGSGTYAPANYNNEFAGRVTLTEALARSLNIPAVKISESLGRDLVRKVAEDFGIDSKLANGPALALGASESTLLEMTGAYAGILNGGSSVTPYGLIDLRLLGDDDPLMGTGGGIGDRVIQEEAAEKLMYMMNAVITEGSGRRAAIDGYEIAGKTGTTQAARDAWFIGFTADYVAGVWMGYDDNRPLTGVTGSGLPADIWRETMSRVHGEIPPPPLPMARRIETPQAPELAPQAQADEPGAVEGLILDVLRGILGDG